MLLAGTYSVFNPPPASSRVQTLNYNDEPHSASSQMDRLPSKKRGRDDPGEDGLLDAIHADKRQRSTASPFDFASFNLMRPPMSRAHTLLPFRLDHAVPPQQQLPPTLEALDADSSSEPSGGNSPASFMSLPGPSEFADVDMNVDESVSIAGSVSPESTCLNHNSFLRPDKKDLRDQFHGGRIPTPIHSSFQIGAPPRSLSLGLNNSFGDSTLPGGFSRQYRPRLVNEADHRMPSPITEDCFEGPTEVTSSQLSRLSVSQNTMDEDNDMDMDDIMSSQQQSPPVSPTGRGRIGRARSDAISTGQSKRVVFGYRDDCAKCRARMPGHWAHFV
ncbi:hypothetical protein FKW77_003901 [Venturia effusa]|uniref:Uncharacterized protein n=1 Tax=Venturia effusa TaxID=50376 RepID=A0A517LIH2_9PEZI|nr:hypothetical protein FKW77_003901 [Venturia effusa]